MTQPDQTTINEVPADQAATLKALIEQLTATNTTGLQQLAQRGIQLGGPDTLNLTVRIEALAEAILGKADQHARLKYELLCQQKFAKVIADAKAQADQAIQQAKAQAAREALLQGVNLPIPNGAQLPPGMPR